MGQDRVIGEHSQDGMSSTCCSAAQLRRRRGLRETFSTARAFPNTWQGLIREKARQFITATPVTKADRNALRDAGHLRLCAHAGCPATI